MQRISPLRSSIEAISKINVFNKTANKVQNNTQATNPFGVNFKGAVVQMDVFESSKKAENNAPSLGDNLKNTLNLASEKLSQVKSNVISFGNNIKENAMLMGQKVQDFAAKGADLNPFKYTVSSLQKRPVAELRTMLTNELKEV